MTALKPLRVLLVEDRDDDAVLLIRELRRGGYEPICERVETPQAMSDALQDGTWDVVISDYAMPHFSGPAALRLLQEQRLDLPFIIVSGTIGDNMAVAALKAGAHDFIIKDNMARLVPALERELRDAGERRGRRQAEIALQASERRFRSLIENMAGIIAVLDATGTVTYGSSSIEPILGYQPEELMGRRLEEFVHPEDIRDFRGGLQEVLQRPGSLVPMEFRIRCRDDSWRMLGAMVRDLRDDPGVQGLVVNAADITTRKQLEEQLRQSQKMDAIGRLAGGVAHDFNNMLGAITGYSELLRMRLGEDGPASGYLQEIIKAAERAASLTSQLLVFSRKEVVAPQVLDLGDVVTNVHKMLRRLIGEDIELVAVLDPAPWYVKVDRGHMDQVLLNLAVNARDAMPQGGKLLIETRNRDLGQSAARQAGVAPGAYVVLSVSDTGCGMDAEIQSHIFEPFFTTKEPGKGTGLGLATVYGIVQQSSGQIQVESAPGEGSTFRIYLPRVEALHGSEPAPESRAATFSGSETVLLVEDEPVMRRMVHQILEMSGYSVLEAMGADEALGLCREQGSGIDLLLTDVVMPGMSGRELAERVAREWPRMRVLFMSGYTDDDVVRHGVCDAEIAFIQKPFKPAALACKVREVLGKS